MTPETVGPCDETRGLGERRRAFREGRTPVAVHGLGKMGLPLAAVYAETCGNVVGVDVDESVVATVADGGCHVTNEPGLSELVAELVEREALGATTDGTGAAERARLHVVMVPTLLRETEPDLSALRTAVETIASGLSEGDLVVVESTVPPDTCRTVVEPLLAERSGLPPDAFGVAFCPERTSSGRALRDVRGAHPKIVGGVDESSTQGARIVYEELTHNDVLVAGDATTAECVKLFEGVYRDVNIALANELARIADELPVDVNEAIGLANTQPYCDLHDPGIGVGGHCIPYYPYFLTETLGTEFPLLETARGVNDQMPLFGTVKLVEGLGRKGVAVEDARIAILGLTYRPGVPETRASPARPIAAELSALGATVYGVDPLLDDAGPFDLELVEQDALPTLDLDGAVLVTAHPEFESIPWTRLEGLAVVDGRNALDRPDGGPTVYTIGGGDRV